MALWRSSGTDPRDWDRWDQILWICGKQWELLATAPT